MQEKMQGIAERSTVKKRRNFTPLWLLSPAGLVLLTLFFAPFGFLVFTSFTDFDQRSLFTGEFNVVGFKQFTRVLTSGEFYASLIRTFVFTAVLVAGTVLIGMWVAQMMTKLNKVMKYVVTVVLIFSWAMPNVASSVVWNWLFTPGYGVVNWLLTQTHLFGDVTDLAWATNTWLAFACIWMLIVWQAVPFVAVTLYAAITQTDLECIEAAQLDGAGPVRIYWQIVVPLIRPTLMIVTMLSVIWDFNVFNQIWLVSQGGPRGTTSTIGVYSYKQAFVSFDIGQGAAISMITVLILMVLSGMYIRNLLRSGEEI